MHDQSFNNEMPTEGEIVSPFGGKEETIQSWPGKKENSIFCKISQLGKVWKAVSNNMAKANTASGLVVFLDKKPTQGQDIKITKIMKYSAVGKVI